MHPEMSEITRKEVLVRMRRRYAAAGLEYKGKLIDEAVELFGYHRKAAIRALRPPEPKPALVHIRGRPREYDPEQLLKPLKVIWLAALQPCGKRLVSALPEWVAAYEEDHRKLHSDVRESLLSASAATLHVTAAGDSDPHGMVRRRSGLFRDRHCGLVRRLTG
jgi:hypothetical protein